MTPRRTPKTVFRLLSGVVVTPEPDPTRLVSPNRNPGDARLILFICILFRFLFQKCRDSNPRSDPNGGFEPEPSLLRRFYLSYQKHFINSFSCGSGFSFGQAHNHLQIHAIRKAYKHLTKYIYKEGNHAFSK